MMEEETSSTESLPDGFIVAKRFKIIQKLGEGGCGSVFKVDDMEEKGQHAMKVEFTNAQGGSILKMEVQILQEMSTKKHVPKLIASGKKNEFSYMVMTLLGESLSSIMSKHGPYFSVSTQCRIGINLLFSLKQIHDIGYIHRDVKPANIALGLKGSAEERIFMLLDFGLARKFYQKLVDGRCAMRRPRERALFRGTAKYCSFGMHERLDQGRVDDLWAIIYILAEMRCKLPWADTGEKTDIADLKKATTDKILFGKSPVQMLDFVKVVRDMSFYERPNYEALYRILADIMKAGDYKWSDPYPWEQSNDTKGKKKDGMTSKEGGGASKEGGVVLIERSIKTKKKSMEPCNDMKKDGSKKTLAASIKGFSLKKIKKKSGTKAKEDGEVPYFQLDDFNTNPLGF